MYQPYLDTIDQNAQLLCNLSDYLWQNPELGFSEYKAADALTAQLTQWGFRINRNISGMPTAFAATYGSGAPHLGILAEYDALPGMSQQAGVAEPRPMPGQDAGHGCGHNLFAAGSMAAALAVKAYIDSIGRGSVTLFGCPAEEGGGGKVFMARDGLFRDIDAIVSWHPECMNMVRTRPALANVKVTYSFTGTASHAGAAPEKGRSALDALELMNIGTNFLREHMELTSRVHYAILDAGGTAPNQVQSHASVLYMIRATDIDAVQTLKARIDRISQGAALMTDTSVTSQVHLGYANLISIPTLQAVANESLHSIPVPVATEQELAFGRAIQATLPLTPAQKSMPVFPTKALQPAPPVAHGGSTDTADVSWVCPVVQFHIATWAAGTPAHSWQAIAQNAGSYAKRAMLYAGKAVAGTIFRLIDSPQLLQQARQEHAERTVAGYVCQLPEDARPVLPANA